jgi:hypothetical protein
MWSAAELHSGRPLEVRATIVGPLERERPLWDR